MRRGNTSLRHEDVDALCLLREVARIDIVKVAGGKDLLDALQQTGPDGSGWVTGVGDVEDAELTVARPGNVQTLHWVGRVTLVSLSGPLGGPFMATLARVTDTGIEMAAGQLTGGRAVSVMLSISRVHEAKSDNLAGQPRGQPEARTARAGGEAETSAAVAAKAVESEGEDEESDVMPQYKDQVEHPVFGLCDVMVAKGDRMKIRDVHGPTRVREIHLSVLKVLPPVERGGVRVFKLVKR